MGAIVNSGQTTAQLTGSVSTGFPSATATQTLIAHDNSTGSISLGVSTLIRTTTATKVFYVQSIRTAITAGSFSGNQTIEIRDNATVKFRIRFTASFEEKFIVLPVPLEFATDIRVFLTGSGTATLETTFVGFEQ